MGNREIKFRAWDKKKSMMFRVLAVDWNYRNIEVAMIPGQHIHKLNLPDVELMQYTGLKDKNGVEIYEGDILLGGLEVRWFEQDARYMLFRIGKDKPAIDLVAVKFNEVIGNIYENPDLLTPRTPREETQ